MKRFISRPVRFADYLMARPWTRIPSAVYVTGLVGYALGTYLHFIAYPAS